jgi:hypothetical protein
MELNRLSGIFLIFHSLKMPSLTFFRVVSRDKTLFYELNLYFIFQGLL